jgi:pimeloyl-ACP methyl ester carboxylesterase
MTRLLAPALSASLLACAAASRPPQPSSTAAERLLEVKGGAGTLRVSDGGAGEPVLVLVHGLACDLETWRPQLDHLRARHRVVAYDQRGHGASARAAEGGYTIDALAGDLDEVVKAVGLGRFVLVGHSMSGEVITAYAGAHPEKVAALVYVDALGDFAALPREQREARLAQEAGFGLSDWKREFGEMLATARPATRAYVLGAMDRADPAAIGALRRSMILDFEAKPRFARWRGPALALEAAGNDFPVLASRVLGVPRVELAGVSHWLQLDAPAETNAAIDRFVAALSAAR